MGMYTEIIFGASLKSETPQIVIDSLMYMMGEKDTIPENFPLKEKRCEFMFNAGSYYFAINSPVCKLWKDSINGEWIFSARSNIKNYEGEIEEFLEWIKPYIRSGSGSRDMYAITIYEESEEPTIHYLN